MVTEGKVNTQCNTVPRRPAEGACSCTPPRPNRDTDSAATFAKVATPTTELSTQLSWSNNSSISAFIKH